MSRCLSDRRVDHVVLERGRVGERWRSERWDSLRMLTPAWQSRLPALRHRVPQPDGYMTKAEVIDLLEAYAASFAAPVQAGTTVREVVQVDGGYRVGTSGGDFFAENVVVATGHCASPYVPGFARRLEGVQHRTPSDYRRPGDLPPGGVLVVEASASGVQIAEELRAAGREVTIAAGAHTRVPRRYRGRDIMWWLEAIGALADRIELRSDPEAARRLPSMQLVGRAGPPLDLGTLADDGVRVVGRVLDAEGTRLRIADDLARTTATADDKLSRLLDRIDAFVDLWGLRRVVGPPERPTRVSLPRGPSNMDLRAERIASVVWATGYRRTYPWLRVPVLDERGEIVHSGGVTPAPGLYVLGMQFLRHRTSSWLDGVGRDAAYLADHIDLRRRRASPVAA